MTDICSPYYCRDIEEAVKDNAAVDDPQEMIERHNKRVERERRKAQGGNECRESAEKKSDHKIMLFSC